MGRSREAQLSNRARRHFLGVSAAFAGRVAAVAALASTAVSSTAKADLLGDLFGRHRRGDDRPNCFFEGTRILTSYGEVRIEDLRIGDLVTTKGGKALPIKWIGRNTYKKNGVAWPKGAIPIRISRFAIGEDMPHADLYLSPDHALFIDGSLIPAKYLMNGTSITAGLPPSTGETLEYFQIVFETHEVIWAQGLAAESFVARSKADYEVFTNFAEYDRLYPASHYEMEQFAPELSIGGRGHLKALFGAGLACFLGAGGNSFDDIFERIDARGRKLELAA